ncbi:class I SAM-dependent methyltransferase [Bdellovibrio sp. HCB274]|uniref:class I SAM-dependent methyltransferase n=1 Tax=Bdellovibrio sp. HCB274 TaxID=3394361 RepID=UPI0039B6744A
MSKPSVDFFPPEAALVYDEKNKKLAPISEGMLFLIRLLLKDLPTQAKVLCVGAGTGNEILALAHFYPEWKFVALDPSQGMLDVCRERITKAGLADRCEFIKGYVHDSPADNKYDAVLSILVAHFIPKEERLNYFKDIHTRLLPGGYVVNTEISFDLNSAEFPQMLENWKTVQSLMGATHESLAKVPEVLKNVLAVLPPSETEKIFREGGFAVPVRFFQAFMICGWYAQKAESK